MQDLHRRLTSTDVARIVDLSERLEGPWMEPRWIDDEGELASVDGGDVREYSRAAGDREAGGAVCYAHGIARMWRQRFPWNPNAAKLAAEAYRQEYAERNDNVAANPPPLARTVRVVVKRPVLGYLG